MISDKELVQRYKDYASGNKDLTQVSPTAVAVSGAEIQGARSTVISKRTAYTKSKPKTNTEVRQPNVKILFIKDEKLWIGGDRGEPDEIILPNLCKVEDIKYAKLDNTGFDLDDWIANIVFEKTIELTFEIKKAANEIVFVQDDGELYFGTFETTEPKLVKNIALFVNNYQGYSLFFRAAQYVKADRRGLDAVQFNVDIVYNLPTQVIFAVFKADTDPAVYTEVTTGDIPIPPEPPETDRTAFHLYSQGVSIRSSDRYSAMVFANGFYSAFLLNKVRIINDPSIDIFEQTNNAEGLRLYALLFGVDGLIQININREIIAGTYDGSGSNNYQFIDRPPTRLIRKPTETEFTTLELDVDFEDLYYLLIRSDNAYGVDGETVYDPVSTGIIGTYQTVESILLYPQYLSISMDIENSIPSDTPLIELSEISDSIEIKTAKQFYNTKDPASPDDNSLDITFSFGTYPNILPKRSGVLQSIWDDRTSVLSQPFLNAADPSVDVFTLILDGEKSEGLSSSLDTEDVNEDIVGVSLQHHTVNLDGSTLTLSSNINEDAEVGVFRTDLIDIDISYETVGVIIPEDYEFLSISTLYVS